MADTILITGATGNVGSVLVPLLAERPDCLVRAMTRDPGKHADTFPSSVQLVAGSFEDALSLSAGMQDADTVVLMAPPGPDCVQQNRAVIRAAKERRAKKIVRVSAIKAAENGKTEGTRLHGVCDTLLQESGLTHTILRPNYFMQNILLSLESINSHDCFYAGVGDGRLATIDIRDVAESVVAAVTPGQFDGQVLEISGPESISFGDMATVLSGLTGRPISYIAISPDDVKASLLQMGFSEWMGDLLREYSQAYSEGWGNLVTDNVERLTGHPPRSFRQYALECLTPFLN